MVTGCPSASMPLVHTSGSAALLPGVQTPVWRAGHGASPGSALAVAL
jgi:hypothetical protein